MNARGLLRAWLVGVLVLSGFAGAWAADAPSCAVLTFSSGPGVDTGLAASAANRLSALLSRSDRYSVLSRYHVHQALQDKQLDATASDHAVRAGQALDVDYVISGRVELSGAGFVLSTQLVDVKSGAVVSEVRSLYSGDAQGFLHNTPDQNIRELLGESTPVAEPAAPEEVAAAAPVDAAPEVPEATALVASVKAAPAVPVAPAPVAEVHTLIPPPTPAAATPAAPNVAAPRAQRPTAPAGPSLMSKTGSALGGWWSGLSRSTGDWWSRASMGTQDAAAHVWDDDENILVWLVADRLVVGTRMTDFSLDAPTRRGATDEERFLGTIDELSEKQSSSPTKFFIRYFPIRWLGVEWTQDEIEAQTFTDADNNHSDGTFKLDGPILAIVGRVTLEEVLRVGHWTVHGGVAADELSYAWAARVRPYLGFGTADFSGSFNEEPWWLLGYPDPVAWAAAGSPTTRVGGRRRTIDITDSKGDVMILGCSVNVTDHFFVDVYWREMAAEVDATYTRSDSSAPPETRPIPLDNTAYGLGVGWAF